jgi:hypothetical protein
MAGQFVVTSATKADIDKIRRRLQQLSSSIAASLFKGSYPNEAALIAEHGDPKEGWNYYNEEIGQTLTYHDGSWYQYTIDGENGTNSNYLGEFSTAPSDPVTDDAYYDSIDGVIYIYNGVAWEIMSQSGTGIDVTYNDSNLDATPLDPTGDGTTGGWHLDATEDVNWLSQRISGEGFTSQPIAHLLMNDNLATTVVLDDTANSNDGVSTQDTDQLSESGKINEALDFATDNDKVDITAFTGLPSTRITVAGWCYFNSNKDYNFVIGHEWTDSGWMLYADANGQPIFGIAQNGVQTNTVSTYEIAVDTWVHLAGTYDGKTIKIYANAVLVGSALLSGATIDSAGDVIIGHTD